MLGDNKEQFVTIDQFTLIIDKQHAIAIAVKGNTQSACSSNTADASAAVWWNHIDH